MIEIKYKNDCGSECIAILKTPNEIHHCYWTSKRVFGRYQKVEKTYLEAFLSKLKKGQFISMNQIPD